MTYSANDYAADTLSITLETIDEALEKCETESEREAISAARREVHEARKVVLEREEPTPTQQLANALTGTAENQEVGE